MLKNCPHLATWRPFPGGTFDLASLKGPPSPPEASFTKNSWNFEHYMKPLEALARRALTTLDDVQQYFDWARFAEYDLLLNVVETDDTFKRSVREFWVDFAGERAVVSKEMPREGNTFWMRVRSSSFRTVLQQGSSWDDIMIGFQGRFNVTPDIYHFKFLNHFANTLPESSPNLPLRDPPSTPVLGTALLLAAAVGFVAAFAALAGGFSPNHAHWQGLVVAWQRTVTWLTQGA